MGAVEDTAARLYDAAVVIGGLYVSNWNSPAVFRSLHAGRITSINATSAIWEDFRGGMDNVAEWLQRFRTYEDVLMQVKTVADIRRAKGEGKVGVILGWQTATPIEARLDRLALFHGLGARGVLDHGVYLFARLASAASAE